MKKRLISGGENRQEFISRMTWLISEIHLSDKGSPLDYIQLLDFHLKIRETELERKFLNRLQLYIYENVDGNKQKLFNNFIDLYENQKE